MIAEVEILRMIKDGTDVEGKNGLEGEFEHSKVLRNITEKKINDEIFERACQYIKINEKSCTKFC